MRGWGAAPATHPARTQRPFAIARGETAVGRMGPLAPHCGACPIRPLRRPGSPRRDQSLERTLLIIKPDGVARGLVGEIIGRFERAAFGVVALKQLTLDDEAARRFYAEHEGKPFFLPLIAFITSGPIVALVLERDEAIARVRQLVGKTNPLEAAPGSVRADLGLDGQRNTVHASDSPASAAREIGLLFGPEFAAPSG